MVEKLEIIQINENYKNNPFIKYFTERRTCGQVVCLIISSVFDLAVDFSLCQTIMYCFSNHTLFSRF